MTVHINEHKCTLLYVYIHKLYLFTDICYILECIYIYAYLVMYAYMWVDIV